MAAEEKHRRPKKTTFSAPVVVVVGQSSPKYKKQRPGHISVTVLNFSQIRSAGFGGDASRTDRHTEKQQT